MRKDNIDWRVLIAAIVALTIIECVALFNGIDGIILTITCTIIGAIAGINIDFKKIGGRKK